MEYSRHQRMLNEKKNAQALMLFKVVAEEHPSSPRAHFAVGVAQSLVGDQEQAVKSLEKVVEMNPKHYEAVEMLRSLKKQ